MNMYLLTEFETMKRYSWTLPKRHSLVQSRQWKQQSIVRNLFKVKEKTPKRRQWRRSGVFIVNFEQITPLLHFTPLFWCFHCWLWRSKCRLGIILKPLLLLWTGTFPAPKHFQYLYGTWGTMKNSFRVTKKTQIDPFQPNIVFHRGNKSWEFQCKFQWMVSIWDTVLGWSGVL